MRTAAILVVAASAASAALFNPTVRLDSGKSATLLGRGPPVVFSSGLFGTSTWRMYSTLLGLLQGNVTIAAVPGPVAAGDVQELADAIGVDRVGFLSHSAFDPDILSSPCVTRAVVCDPIALPLLRSPRAACPTLVVRAGLLFDDERLPEFNRMRVEGEPVSAAVYDDVGHTDLLDDWWAEIAARSGIWRTTRGRRTATFRSWTKSDRMRDAARARRREHREELAARISEFLLPLALEEAAPLSAAGGAPDDVEPT